MLVFLRSRVGGCGGVCGGLGQGRGKQHTAYTQVDPINSPKDHNNKRDQGYSWGGETEGEGLRENTVNRAFRKENVRMYVGRWESEGR